MDPTPWSGTGPPPGGPPPNWYPDPSQPGFWRYFDGRVWTAHVQPAVPVSAVPDPVGDLAGERAARPWVKAGIWFLAFYGPCLTVIYALLFHPLIQQFRNDLDQTNNLHPGQPVRFAGYSGGHFLWADLVGLVALGAEIAVMVWMYRVATMGKRLGMPMTLEPYWAFLGWIIPIVNFWFPYKVVAGAVPLGDPARRHALRWWVLFIAGNVVFGTAGLVFAFLPRVVLLVVLPFVLYSWYEAKQGLAMVQGVDDAHAGAVRARGQAVPPG